MSFGGEIHEREKEWFSIRVENGARGSKKERWLGDLCEIVWSITRGEVLMSEWVFGRYGVREYLWVYWIVECLQQETWLEAVWLTQLGGGKIYLKSGNLYFQWVRGATL